MRRSRLQFDQRWTRLLQASLRVSLFALVAGTSACDDGAAIELDASPDARLELVEIDLQRADSASVEYLQALSKAHAQADALLADDRQAALDRLRSAWDLNVPAGGAARVTQLELSARMAEIMLQDEGGAVDAVALLRPMLDPKVALPKDRSSARALVALGDAASEIDDDALAAGSYARAVRVMSALRKEMAK